MTNCLLKLCAHCSAKGVQCKAPALRQSDYCRHHARVHRPLGLPEYVYQAKTLHEIKLALHRTMQGICNGSIKPPLSGRMLFELDNRIRALEPASAAASARGA